MDDDPGCPWLFCHEQVVDRSKKRSRTISACASRGVDQRLVESWAGHMSKQTRRRYAHLYPSTQQQAFSGVFDNVT